MKTILFLPPLNYFFFTRWKISVKFNIHISRVPNGHSNLCANLTQDEYVRRQQRYYLRRSAKR